MSAHAAPVGAGTQRAEVVRITGRYRLPSDVVSELRHVLADNPRIVLLDLEAVAGSSRVLSEVLEPVAPYLAAWPGTILVACVPDPETSPRALPSSLLDRILLDRSPHEALERAHRVVAHQHRTTTFLTPKPQASSDARAFTRRTLREWSLDTLAWPASLVVSELVTHSILKADTVFELTLNRVDDRIRIAVHDYGSDQLQVTRLAESAELEDPLLHRGLLLVQELTRCWGVFPSRIHGKTVWAVMDVA